MSVIGNPLLLTPEGYQISRSVRLRSSASAYFNRTPASAGNRKTWTWSGWVKRGALGTQQMLMDVNGGIGGARGDITFLSGDTLQIEFNSSGSSWDTTLITTQVFRDPSAWYHIVIALDTTQATAANRLKLYVNGNQVTTFGTTTYPTQNVDQPFNTTSTHNIGRISAGGYYLDGYLTEVNFIDGQALTPSSFGETDAVTGVWKPKKYAGTYGTNGFYLNFSDPSAATAAAIGKDYSGNGNNWTPNNISVTAGVTYDSMLDTPTPYADGGNGRGNYAVVNPLDYKPSATTISQGNLYASTTTSGCFLGRGTIAVSSGKWYWEAQMLGDYTVVGIDNIASPIRSDIAVGATSTSYGYYNASGQKTNNNSGSAYGATYTYGDIIGIALDMDAGTLTFYKNGTSQGTAFSGLSGTFAPAFSDIDVPSGTGILAINFGQRPFAYTPPTGFKALNTQNLPEPTIKKGNQYFDATLWTGNGTTQTITNSGGMQPDFLWAKTRSGTTVHWLVNAVTGAGNGLISNSTAAEQSLGIVTSLNSGGFSVSTNGGTNLTTNGSGATYVGWQWKESPTAGFDIVTYTGDGTSARAISHLLGVAPKMVIVKARSIGTENWNCWHTSLNNTAARILLNTTGAVDTGSPTVWGTGGINPTSTTFQVGSAAAANGNGTTYVAYCFAEVPGFSKFGSYTGNGSTDGPFVFCGFRPRYLMIKRTDGTQNWFMHDTTRNTFNAVDKYLMANLSDAEATLVPPQVDFVANGFKLRGTSAGYNASGGTYIFMAFSESPFKHSLAR